MYHEFNKDLNVMYKNSVKETNTTTSVSPAKIVLDEDVESSSVSVSSKNNQNVFIIPQAFKGILKASKRNRALKIIRKSYSSILNDTPEKNKLEAIFKNQELLKHQILFVKKKKNLTNF